MLKAVLFDVDGVMIDSFEANFKFYQNFFKYLDYPSPTREDYPSLFHKTMEDVIRISTGLSDEKEIKRIWQIGKEHRKEFYPLKLLKFPDNLEKVITLLSEKYILGIVTSRFRGGIFLIPELAKLEKYFQEIVYFEDTQKHKPDPEPLLLASERLKINPDEIVYIGDMQSDITAAKSAGMKVILYSKEKLNGADAVASEFVKLPEIINSLKHI